MTVSDWLSNNYIEVFGAITGIIYVFLEIRQTIWLWPVGIITSAVYIWVFFTSKFYADMSLQGYYLVISCLGWYWWYMGSGRRAQGAGLRAQGSGLSAQGRRAQGRRAQGRRKKEGEKGRKGDGENKILKVTRLELMTGVVLGIVFVLLYTILWFVLSHFTDSPVPEWDSFLTSLSIVATWMLARKIYEHWLLWIVVNSVSFILYFTRGLYPTVVLYFVYAVMSFIGLKAWKTTFRDNNVAQS